MNNLYKYLIYGGGVILLLLLSSCTNDDDKKMIVCWGDSLTASHTNGTGYKGMVKGWIKGDDSYPGVLQDLLGDDYDVVNCGVGGENTLTIMARQGAYPMLLAHDVVLFNDEERKFDTFIGNNDIRHLFLHIIIRARCFLSCKVATKRTHVPGLTLWLLMEKLSCLNPRLSFGRIQTRNLNLSLIIS